MESRSRNKVGNKNKKSIMKFPVQKSIKNLEIGDLFSFRNKSAVHMVVKQGNFYTEYKSYNDGKIRTCSNDNRFIFLRTEWDKIYEAKWFKQ